MKTSLAPASREAVCVCMCVPVCMNVFMCVLCVRVRVCAHAGTGPVTPVCREHPPSKITEILSGNSALCGSVSPKQNCWAVHCVV